MAKPKKSKTSDPTRLRAFDRKHPVTVNAVIEIPGGSRNKFKHDEMLGCFEMER